MTTGQGDWWLPALILGGIAASLIAGLYASLAKPEPRWARYGLIAIALLGALAALWGALVILQSGA